MKLVIVESPAKAKTIKKYLGPGFEVKSSYGHVRDLPKKNLGVDTAGNFTPNYVVPPQARKNVSALKKAAQKANEIYFATDEDREGEAIAWHLKELLQTPDDRAKRITFDEITQNAIKEAISHPRGIDINRVDAQQARRILDRLVGYELSPLLWKKVRRGLSAGRVQSVAVRLIVEREEEINAFKPQEYWTLLARLEHKNKHFDASLRIKDGKKIPKLGIRNKKNMDSILAGLKDKTYTVTKVEKKKSKRTPPPPFITSTLQQAAAHQLGFTGKRTMVTAQQLYEGISLGSEGPQGLITYMRTDSTNLAAEATAKARQTITRLFGPEYAISSPRVFRKKAKGAQEAHEAIRPTDPSLTPDETATHLSKDQSKLYRLIWQRLIASQMAEARLNKVSADIAAGSFIFRATGSTVEFDGYVKALGAKAAFKETVLPKLEKGDTPQLQELLPEQHFTQPPPRYSEATLVKALEEHGIGRPSTYAPTIDTIQRRDYVIKNEDKKFQPTEVGALVTNLLKEHFPDIVDTKFTAGMENDLDLVAAGDKQWQPVIRSFYEPFHANLEKKEREINKKELTQEKTGESCPECGGELAIKLGRFGKFKACTGFPECKYTEPVGEEKELQQQNNNEVCPDCGRQLVVRRGRFGPFMGCSGYPDCKHIKKIEKSTGVLCPQCNQGEIVEKTSRRGRLFYACNQYPHCKNAFANKPTGHQCPQCGSLLVSGAQNTVRCSDKQCQFQNPGNST